MITNLLRSGLWASGISKPSLMEKEKLRIFWFKVHPEHLNQVKHARVRLIAAFAAIGIMGFTFQASPYLPKTRVVSETSYEAAKAEAKERKSDINIREKFEQLPDK